MLRFDATHMWWMKVNFICCTFLFFSMEIPNHFHSMNIYSATVMQRVIKCNFFSLDFAKNNVAKLFAQVEWLWCARVVCENSYCVVILVVETEMNEHRIILIHVLYEHKPYKVILQSTCSRVEQFSSPSPGCTMKGKCWFFSILRCLGADECYGTEIVV